MPDQLAAPAASPASIDPQDAMSLMVAADARRNRAIARQRTAAEAYNAALSEVEAATADLELGHEAYRHAQIALLESINRANGGDVDFSAAPVSDLQQPMAAEVAAEHVEVIDLAALEVQHAANEVLAQTEASLETSEADAT